MIIPINFSVMILMLPILLLSASAPTLANSSYQKPSDSNTKPSKGSNITCQAAGLICPAGEGDYKCCDKLFCQPRTVGGAGICLPLDTEEKSPEYRKCRELTKSCTSYGVYYQCCGDLSCVPSSRLNPVGAGFCLPMGRGKKEGSRKDECQELHELCEPWGEFQCCEAFTCADTRTLPYPIPLPVDPSEFPPGIGVCIPKI